MTKKKKSSKSKSGIHNESHKKKEHKEPASHKKPNNLTEKNPYIWPAVAVFMTVIFLIVVFNKPTCDDQSSMKLTGNSVNADELIFVQSDACQQACTEMEPLAKEVAEQTDLEYRKITTPQEVPIPGYMIIEDKETKSLLRPIQDKASFYNEVCSVTNNSEICSEAESLAKKAQDTQQKQQEQSLEDIPKKEKPTVDLYVMSFCPYGNQAENTLEPVYESLKNKVNFNVNYIVSAQGDEIKSLHGTPEVEQNKREVCVLEEYGMDEFFDFITYVNDNCGSKGECWEDAASEAGVDVETIQTCVEERGTELMKEEAQKSEDAGASGSPTMFINGQKTDLVYNYGQSSSYQKAICAGFSQAPSECEESLENVESAQGAAGSC